MMSLVHWDKSVFNLHFKDIIEDCQKGDRTVLLGLGMLTVGTVLLPVMTKLVKPMIKTVIKTGLTLDPKQKAINTTATLYPQEVKLLSSNMLDNYHN